MISRCDVCLLTRCVRYEMRGTDWLALNLKVTPASSSRKDSWIRLAGAVWSRAKVTNDDKLMMVCTSS